MGYGYAETFLIVFLTHPNVILPTALASAGKATGIVPGPVASILPNEESSPTFSGLWQVLWVWILSLPGNKGAGFARTMYIIYLVFLFVYMYFFLRIRMTMGI